MSNPPALRGEINGAPGNEVECLRPKKQSIFPSANQISDVLFLLVDINVNQFAAQRGQAPSHNKPIRYCVGEEKTLVLEFLVNLYGSRAEKR